MPRRLQLGHQNHSSSRTDVFDSLAQQVFCLVIREGFRDVTAICRPEYIETCSTLLPCKDDSNLGIKTNPVHPTAICRPESLRHDPRSSHAKTTPIGASKPIQVSEIRPRFVVRNTLRHDPRSSHAKTTPIGASKPLRFSNTTRTHVFDSLAQQVFCLVIREGFRAVTAICRPEYVET
ncbi:uncharacterized protein G2W53_010370 [Senna tora]|uniref:Uncharacterized protein n=1 Tax=Senna tora TaxID=362788 RepID=A0A835C9B0_9FABA|nr:uncharacterized protein G2W53_010370 [Senna tora]